MSVYETARDMICVPRLGATLSIDHGLGGGVGVGLGGRGGKVRGNSIDKARAVLDTAAGSALLVPTVVAQQHVA